MADGSTDEPGSHGSAAAGPESAVPDHGEGHELAIAALLDRQLPADQLAEAERLIETCPACAALRGDLVSLAAATREMPVPPRRRDFQLTAEDARRLATAPAPATEPHGAAARLTGEMQVPDTDHRTHDQLLVAGLLDRATRGLELDRGEALVETCAECAALHRDLVALRAATRELPTPPRVRDYALSAADAHRLRRTGWRRLVAVFGSTRDAFSRPLAIGLTTIGLAGLLVTAVPGALPGGSGTAGVPTLGQAAGDAGSGANSESVEASKAAPAPSAAASAPGPAAAALTAPSSGPSGAAAPAPSAAPAASDEPAPSAEIFDTFAGAGASPDAAAVAPVPAPSAGRQGAGRTATTSIAQDTSFGGRMAVVALAAVLFVAGIALFGLRWAGRRV